MVFSSHIFLFYFLPVFLFIYFLLPFTWKNFYVKNFWITIGSYLFYGWLMPWYIVPMFFSTLKNYICGQIIVQPGQLEWKRKTALIVAVAGDLAMLAFFKYTPLTLQAYDKLNHLFGGSSDLLSMWHLVLPAGISFYTFVAISYVIDLYRGEAKPARNFSAFTCFIALYPHLIAGPIIRYNSVAEMLDRRTHTVDMFLSGMAIFMLGFAKKILLANSAGIIADTAFRAGSIDTMAAWWGILAYHFQIYFDFCGYSDMAVGLARMLGIEFIKNFNAPYHSVSITDFWRRWHISLSTFIRDYLYIPMGGNRLGTGRTYANLVTAFLICGLWHGAKMTFVLWGVFQGVFMILERLRGKKGLLHGLPLPLQIAITNVIVMISWAIFRAPSLSQGVEYWKAMVGLAPAGDATPLLHSLLFTPQNIIGMLICGLVVWQTVQAHEWVKKLTVTKMIICVIIFLYAVCAMFTQTYNPFLYFQF
ncbi:MAG: MBOAT family protein [Chitinispirillaceae bacterium]|nr:MBOAT family protein [Chitinispirillaceae bacterium]